MTSPTVTPAPRRSRERWAGITGGIVLIAIGFAFLLAELHLLSIRHFWRWAPLVLVVLGAGKILTAGSFAKVKSGLVLTLIGGWGLLNTHGVWIFDWDNSWPLLLIGFGAIAVLEAIVKALGFDRVRTNDGGLYGAVATAALDADAGRGATATTTPADGTSPVAATANGYPPAPEVARGH